jgi:hypothetical protein
MKWREKKNERKKPGDNACRCQALVDGGDTRRLFGMLSVALVLVRAHSGIIHQPYSTSCHLQMLQSLKACTHRLIVEKKTQLNLHTELTDTDSWIGVISFLHALRKALPTSDNQIVDLFVRNISQKHGVIESSEHTHDFINEEEKRSTKEGGDEVALTLALRIGT